MTSGTNASDRCPHQENSSQRFHAEPATSQKIMRLKVSSGPGVIKGHQPNYKGKSSKSADPSPKLEGEASGKDKAKAWP